MGVSVQALIENQSETKHVESLNNRRLDEGSNPSDSTLKGVFFLRALLSFSKQRFHHKLMTYDHLLNIKHIWGLSVIFKIRIMTPEGSS